MSDNPSRPNLKPRSTLAAVVLLVCMIVVIVGMDLLFFRGPDWTAVRLVANVGVVLVSGLIYVKFIAR